jgi:hypothetical protein
MWAEVLSQTRAWLIQRLAQPQAQSTIRRKKLLLCAVVFLTALGVRLLMWQDLRAELMRGRKAAPNSFARSYLDQAQQMIEDGALLLPNKLPEKGDVRMIVHPPGYSILLVALYGRELNRESYTLLRLIQAICDSAAAVLVFLIMAELFSAAMALVSGMVVAFSPHLAYYSLWLSPDSLAALPVVLGIYLLLLSVKGGAPKIAIGAGICIGLSCWLRSNALLLAPFLGLCLLFIGVGSKRLKQCAGLTCGAIAAILPIMMRNYVISGHTAVLTVVKGLNLVQGIGELDVEGKFGMPVGDREAAQKDAEWHNRPEYGKNLWSPDGVERDRARVARGLKVIRENPGWFMRGMLYRASFIISYNDGGRYRWPFNTSQVPVISSEPTFGHSLGGYDRKSLVWFSSAEEAVKRWDVISAGAVVQRADGWVEVKGDRSEFGDQLASERIAVRKWNDYVLRLWGEVVAGAGAVKVTSADRRIGLASGIFEGGVFERSGLSSESERVMELGFSSGDRREVRVVLSNNGAGSSLIRFRRAELYEAGATPLLWTRWLRWPIRSIQKGLYRTDRGRSLIAIGIILLFLGGRGRESVFLLLVPIYYLLTHSGFSTEYRYILAAHDFLLAIMGISLYFAGALLIEVFRIKSNARV